VELGIYRLTRSCSAAEARFTGESSNPALWSRGGMRGRSLSCSAFPGRALFILHIFFERVLKDWRLSPVHLASAALQLRVKRTAANE
jgi:hypothetical protein